MSTVEVVTLSDSVNDLMSILAYSTIIGKQINNVVKDNKVYLGVNYGNGKIIYNNQEKELAIYGLRNAKNSIDTFNKYYPEGQLQDKFKTGLNIDIQVENNPEFKYVVLDNRKAHIIYIVNGEEKNIIYDFKTGFEK